MKLSLLLSSSLMGAMLFISGCSSKNMTVNDSQFLDTKEDFKETAKLEGTKTYFAPKADFTHYKNIYIAPVKVLAVIDEKDQTPEQKLLISQISEYLTMAYKQMIQRESIYTLVDSPEHANTLVYEGSISSVSVEFDDLNGMSYMPMMFVGTMIARATFKDGSIRILGEGRIKDAQTGEVLIQMMRLEKGKEIDIDEDKLVFKDVKPVLDNWLNSSTQNLKKLRAGILQHQEEKS